MAHKVFQLPKGTTYVAGARDGVVWLRTQEEGGGHVLLALDAETGRERQRWPMEGGRPYVRGFFATRTGALVLDAKHVQHLEIATGKAGPRMEGTPLALSGDGETAAIVQTPHALALIPFDATGVRTRNPVRNGYPPSFGTVGTYAGGKFLYKSSDSVICADADTLRIGWLDLLGASARWEWKVFSAAGRAFAAMPVDTRQGPTTVLAEIDLGNGKRTEVLTLRGRMDAHSDGGDLLVAQMEHADETHEVIAWKPGDAAPAFVLPIPDGGWAGCCHASGAFGVAVHRGALDVFAIRDGKILATRVPQPEHYTPTAAVDGRSVFAISDALYRVDSHELPFAAEIAAHDTRFEGDPPRTVPASAVDVATWKQPPGKSVRVLRESAERFGFVVPPLLEKMLGLYDTDPIARSWIRASGLEMGVSGFAECWLGVDPALLGFAGDGSGQQHALYVYPPRMKPGVECAVVYWDHETREVSWQGATFAEFLAEHLERMRDENPDKLAFLLERLELPPDFASGREWVPPPEFFQQAHGERTRGTTLEAANAAIDADPIAGERLLVAYVRDNETDENGIATMEQLYERLGWRFHRENLRQLKHVANR